jgi:hypothetical protein
VAKSSDATLDVKARRTSDVAKKSTTQNHGSKANLHTSVSIGDQNSCVIVMGIAQSTGGQSSITNITKRIHETFI